MPRQSINLTESNAEWVKARIESKEYTSMSDAVNDLIRQIRRQEDEKIEKIRAMLIKSEESLEKHGHSQKTVHDIWDAGTACVSHADGLLRSPDSTEFC